VKWRLAAPAGRVTKLAKRAKLLFGGGAAEGAKLARLVELLSKNNNNGWCFLEAVLGQKERIGHRGVVNGEAAVKATCGV
jgi:hypothetical protein